MQQVIAARRLIRPHPFPYYYWTVVILAGLGLAASIYLSASHYRVFTDISYRSFCAVSRTINCDTVSQSPYAVLLNVPVPVWGIAGYAFLLIFLLLFAGPRNSRGRGFAAANSISLAFSVYSVVLALISSYKINAYCIVCIFTYAINFALAFMTWLVRKRFEDIGYIQALLSDIRHMLRQSNTTACFATVSAGMIILLLTSFPAYWKVELSPGELQLPTGLTADGHPWIGSATGPIVITEYSDYLCFQCKKMNYYLRQLIAKYPDRIKLIHRHFPMDSQFNPILKEPFHEGAGIMALIAIYAATKEKFWEVNDHLFSIAGKDMQVDPNHLSGPLGLEAKQLNAVVNDPITRRTLIMDIRQALKLGVTGTPSYVIGDQIYHGMLPADVLRQINGTGS